DGGDGDDRIGIGKIHVPSGSSIAFTVHGGAGDDALYARGVDDVLLGGDGNDTLSTNGTGALLDGGDGDDRIGIGKIHVPSGSSIAFTVHGGAGDDALYARGVDD
ncbi:hypothetical protein WCE10_22045, partial [Cronobacter muytjensii]